MDHIPEEELVLFAFDPKAVPDDRRVAIEEHTAGCADCRSLRDFFAVTEEDLSDSDVWERSVGSATLDSLRNYASQIAEEDRDADEMLEPFFASAMKTAWTKLHNQRRFLTGGVARRLSAHAHSICESEPLDALTFADAAISVAEALPDDTYAAKAVFDIRGTAWKERANAQMLLGDCVGALDSLTHAERAYKQLRSPALGLATVALVRASALYQQQRLEEAGESAAIAERAFAHLGDEDRRMTALYLRGSISYEARDFASAVAIFQQVVYYGESLNDPSWIARGSYAWGNCEVERDNITEASIQFHKAQALFREIGRPNERLSTEWGVARVLLRAGKQSDAIRRLRDVVKEFECRGMVTDAALAGLDIADGLLALGKTRDIVELASALFRVLTDAGMLTGALTAIAYIKEAAAAGTLDAADVRVVRRFLRHAGRQPELVFIPPFKKS